MFLERLSLKSKIALGLISSYSIYAAIVVYKTNSEIEKRTKKYHQDKDGVARFGPLVVLGRYQNPFYEYEHETLFHFAYNQVRKLFSVKNIVNVENSTAWRLHMPIYKPDFFLMFNNSKIKNDINPEDSDEMVANRYHSIPPLSSRLVFTWLGQSSAYIQISDKNILTDPVFNDHIINKRFGPKRLTPSPAQIEDLPTPDIVLVSHNHPDHLEPDSIKKLSTKKNTLWVVPDGVGSQLKSNGVESSKIIEMSWWQRQRLDEHWEVACCPAKHWSGNWFIDFNNSLWCSFILFKDQKPVLYHMGDTGYQQDLFESIKSQYCANQPISLILAPIGQYTTSKVTNHHHMSPTEVVKVASFFNAKKTMGVHYGTFALGLEPLAEPRRLLAEMAAAEGLNGVFPGEFGQTVTCKI
ncbi:N-acetylphosphatidylethanolamine-hydrolyzing phospholipase D [Saccharomycopsis crataegensis]|uniref:N-acetylphosphatidylethanolamine-hydrolyzing phospholipase D n=1 Tax=Saccharomycopsis crataegensis TaxID=43959 RepID=A0AAV5QIW0_9ASCO|nr:N-acetylphosphatidylethanolamine-hydrolyzing phospholipase D [Saccharomycopsis crataegensis]